MVQALWLRDAGALFVVLRQRHSAKARRQRWILRFRGLLGKRLALRAEGREEDRQVDKIHVTAHSVPFVLGLCIVRVGGCPALPERLCGRLGVPGRSLSRCWCWRRCWGRRGHQPRASSPGGQSPPAPPRPAACPVRWASVEPGPVLVPVLPVPALLVVAVVLAQVFRIPGKLTGQGPKSPGATWSRGGVWAGTAVAGVGTAAGAGAAAPAMLLLEPRWAPDSCRLTSRSLSSGSSSACRLPSEAMVWLRQQW